MQFLRVAPIRLGPTQRRDHRRRLRHERRRVGQRRRPRRQKRRRIRPAQTLDRLARHARHHRLDYLEGSTASQRSSLAWVALPNLEEAGALLDRLNHSATRPVALDLLNHSAARTIGIPLGLPASGAVLAIGFEDNAASVAWQLDRLLAEVEPLDLRIVENEAAESLWNALTEFQEDVPCSLSLLANVRPSAVSKFVARLDPERWSIQAHAGNGIVLRTPWETARSTTLKARSFASVARRFRSAAT